MLTICPYRRVMKWTGLAVCALIAGAWALSLFWLVGWSPTRANYGLVMYNGAVIWTGWFPYTRWVGSYVVRPVRVYFPSICWWPDWARRGWLVTPLWMPFAIVALPTALLWWLDRPRFLPGHCRKCGYDLTGNVSGVCPECGAPAR